MSQKNQENIFKKGVVIKKKKWKRKGRSDFLKNMVTSEGLWSRKEKMTFKHRQADLLCTDPSERRKPYKRVNNFGSLQTALVICQTLECRISQDMNGYLAVSSFCNDDGSEM